MISMSSAAVGEVSTSMVSRPEPGAWDFSQVLELVNALSSSPPVDRHIAPPPAVQRPSISATTTKDEESPTGLGNFSRLWNFLGVPNDTPPPNVPPLTSVTPPDQPAYTSDGATYQTPAKGVKWMDEAVDNGELTDIAPNTEPVDHQALTKTQRKKLRRRQRQELASRQKTASDFESEGEGQRAPARKASVHNVLVNGDEPKRTYNLRPRDNSGKAMTNLADWKPPNGYPKSPKGLKEENGSPQSDQAAESRYRILTREQHPVKPVSAPASTAKNVPPKKNSHATPKAQPNNGLTEAARQDMKEEVLAALRAGYQLQIPAHVQHVTTPAYTNLPQQINTLQQSSFYTPTRQRSKPLVIRQGEDRNLALRLTLIRDFGEDKKWLTSPVQLANHTNSSTGIHVFIDFSNIWIGFMELMKRLNGLHPKQRSPHTNISFDSLILLLERGRPVTKRVLAGSAPFLPAFDTAKAIGYELNILDKVFKAKELTERQRRFQAGSTPLGDASGGSGSENMTLASGGPVFAPEKWVEQGVDEILHLKMLESVVDTVDAQGSTMVLATGDAAQAEYSAGFMKMVERALKKGWKVELVSWSKAISFDYRRKEWVDGWNGRFRIIQLDDFAEYLLDT